VEAEEARRLEVVSSVIRFLRFAGTAGYLLPDDAARLEAAASAAGKALLRAERAAQLLWLICEVNAGDLVNSAIAGVADGHFAVAAIGPAPGDAESSMLTLNALAVDAETAPSAAPAPAAPKTAAPAPKAAAAAAKPGAAAARPALASARSAPASAAPAVSSWKVKVPSVLGGLLEKGDRMNLVLELHGGAWRPVECGGVFAGEAPPATAAVRAPATPPVPPAARSPVRAQTARV